MSGEIIKGRRISSCLPIVGMIRTYDRRWLRGDLIAGVTVAALIVPKNLGYAGIAGVGLDQSPAVTRRCRGRALQEPI
jgi:hypothetical protein